MKKTENECVGCPTEIGCIGDRCRYYNTTRYYCDKCGDETRLYHFDDGEYCADCILDMLDIVEGSNY